MSRMIDDEEELKDYGLIEKCSNLVTDGNKCLDTWDDENADYKECKRINCYKKQLKWLKAENEKLKKELEWQKVANRKFLLDKDFLMSELRDLRIEYAKLYQENEKLKLMTGIYSVRLMEKYKQALEEVKYECTKPLNEKFSVNDFLYAKDEELTEVGIIQRNILKIINEVLNI